MKEAYYFSHDSNARNDIKIIRLRRQLGLEGYGIFWCLIEMLRDTPEHKLPLDSIDDIAFEISTSKEKINTVITGYGLFAIDEKQFFSDRLLKSMGFYNQKKLQFSEGGKKGMQTRWAKKNDSKDNNSFV